MLKFPKVHLLICLVCLFLLPVVLLILKVGYPLAEQQLIEGSLAEVKMQPPNTPIPNTLFSLHTLNLQYGATWPEIPFGSWRSWDAAGTWAYLEEQKGAWNFQLLDRYVALAQQSGVEIILVLGLTPQWASVRPNEESPYRQGSAAEPKQLQDWENYVRQVATRYQGKVRHYEIWNEPNADRFYSGSVKQLVSLAKIAYLTLKSIDPSIKVISPAMSPCCNSFDYLDAYLQQGGGNYADIVGYHFYVAPHEPEAMLPNIARVKKLMAKHGLVDKPLWNTETGWRIQNRDVNLEDESWAGEPLSMDNASAFVARAYIISWAARVERLYWYAWGHRSMGFTDYDGRTPKPVAEAFIEVQKWLVGAVLTSCQPDNKNTWICELKRDNRRVARIVWNSKANVPFEIPAVWSVKRVKTLYGRSFQPASRIQINPLPLLLEN